MTVAEAQTVHASAIVLREHGVVIRGPSGTGKSTFAIMLIEAALRRGWFARLVGDDRLVVDRFGDAILVAPHPALAGLIERRTQPIGCMVYEPRCRLGLLVELIAPDNRLPRLPEAEEPSGSDSLWGDTPVVRLQAPPHPVWCSMVLDKVAAL